MKKTILILALFLMSLFAFAQSIEGNWNGALDIQGTQLPLVFHIETKDGKLVGTMDSPSQKAFGIPVQNTSFESNELSIGMPNLKINYKGKPNNDFSEIEGTFYQMGMEIPLKLSRNAIKKVALVRPQTPKGPFPYREEEVTFKNDKEGITLAGTLTLPNKKGNYPVVVLITGSGAQDRNEEIFEHKPFAVIADDLTRKGIAVLRIDDRGVGRSTGSFLNSTTADFATDIIAAIAFLKTKNEINSKKIGLIGHSEGGMIAPMVAAQSKDVHFIVLMAAPGTGIDELMVEQTARAEKLAGINDDFIKRNSDLFRGVCAIIKKGESNDLEEQLTAYLKENMPKLPEGMRPKTEAELNDAIANQVKIVTGKWFQYFIKYIPSENLSKIKCPVLAINGALDFQVPSTDNLKAIQAALVKGQNKNFKAIELPGLNHLFQEATTGAFEEYAKIEQTISPKALEVMTTWIIAQTK